MEKLVIQEQAMNAVRKLWRRGLGTLSAAVVGLAMLNTPSRAGTFSYVPLTGDADSGLAIDKTYSHAVSLVGNATTANGVVFEVANTAGTNWTFTGTSTYGNNSGTGYVAGNIGNVLQKFQYGEGTVTLTGLIPGQSYVTTWYSKGWEAAGGRVIDISASDGGSITFDQDVYGQGNGSLLQYSFVAPGDGSMAYVFAPVNTGATFHMYGFSNELATAPANQWALTTGGSWNQTSSWTAGTIPNGAGAEAWLTQQTTGQADITVDSPVTAGAIYVDNTSGYRILGPQTLTLQAASGRAIVALQQGSLTLGGTTAIASDTDVTVLGGSTLQVSGNLTGSGQIFKSGLGSLYMTNSSPGYSGQINVLGGSMRLDNAGGAGTGTINIGAGSYTQLWYRNDRNTIANDFILNGIGTNQGGYTKASIYGDGAGGGAGLYTLTGQITLNATSNVGGHNGNDMLITGRITGAGGLQKGGSGSFNDGVVVTLTNPLNDYAGGTIVGSGTLRLGASEVIPDGPGKGGLTVNTGTTFDLGAHSETINTLSGGGSITWSGIVGPTYFTTDAGTGISSSKTYTHALDFNAGASVANINGVAFAAAGTTGATWTLNAGGTAGNANTGMIPASGGMHTLLEDFYYGANPGQLALTGLTPGETYELRFYNRRWGGDRTQAITYTAGTATASLNFNEDASDAPSYIGYRYVADATGTVTARFAINNSSNASYHFYGLTNEVVPASALPTLTVSDGNFSGSISGMGRLIKQSAGQLLLSGASTYTGGTDIQAGSLRVGNPAVLGTGDVSIASGANLLLWWNSVSPVLANNITLNGPGSVSNKSAIYADGGGGGYGEYELSGLITLNATSDVGGNNANSLRLSGQITGPGGLTKGGYRPENDDRNTVILAGSTSNDYAGETTLVRGTLTLAKTGGAVAVPGNVTLGTGVSGGDLWLRMAGPNQFGGQASVVTFDNGGNNAKFQLNGYDQTVGGLVSVGNLSIVQNAEAESTGIAPVTLTIDVADAQTYSFGRYLRDRAGGDAGSLSIVKTGLGTQVFSGANISYTGTTTIQQGTLATGASNSLPDGTAVTVLAGGTLDIGTYTDTIGSLAGEAGASVLLGSGAVLRTGNNNASTTFAGVISGDGSLAKAGSGTMYLTGANSYAGITTFAAGTVNVATVSNYGVDSSLGNRAADSGAGNVGLLFQGGTLQYTGSTPQSTDRAIRVSTTGGAFIDASGSNSAATLSFTRTTASPDFYENGGNRQITFTGTNTGDNTFAMPITSHDVNSTNVNKTGPGTWVLSGANTYRGVTYIHDGTLRVTSSAGLGQGGHDGATMTWIYDGGALELTGGINLSEHAHFRGDGPTGLGAIRSLSGANSFSDRLALDADATINVEAGSTLTFTGAKSGSEGALYEAPGTGAGMTKIGDGLLRLNSGPTYTGATAVRGGKLFIASAQGTDDFVNLSVASGGPVTLANNASLALWQTGNSSFNMPIVLDNSGQLAVDGIGGGSFGINTISGGVSGTGNLTLFQNGSEANSIVLAGAMTHTGGLNLNRPTATVGESVTLAAANTYGGDTNVNSGVLRTGVANALPGTTHVNLASGTTLDLAGNSQTIAGLTDSGRVEMMGPTYFNTDAGMDLSTSKSYTHLLDFYDDGTPAVISGVAFTSAGNSGATWTLTGATTAHDGNGGTIPTYLDDAGGENLLRSFLYNGNPAVLTLSGLTAGETYETRIYARRYGGDRTQLFTFDEDLAAAGSCAVLYNSDAGPIPSYLSYRFTAVSDGVGGAKPLTVTVTPQGGAGTFHWYGMSNEVTAASIPSLTVGDANDSQFDGVISGPGQVVKQGSGTWTLTGANTYSGGTVFQGGKVNVSADSSLGGAGGPLTFNGGALGATASFTLDPTRRVTMESGGGTFDVATGQTLRVNQVIGGVGGLGKSGAGTLELAATNSYGGDTVISGGTLKLETVTGLLLNPSFELPALGANSFRYWGGMSASDRAAFVWIGGGNGTNGPALENGNSAWGYTTPKPDGVQAVSLQKDSSVSQTIDFPAAGEYTLTWYAERRGGQVNPAVVSLDGTTLSSWSAPSGSSWTQFSTTFTVAAPGVHTLQFAGTVTASDVSVAIDKLELTAPAGSLPSTTAVRLTGVGATLDLNGVNQTIGSLDGIGGTNVLLGGSALRVGSNGGNAVFGGTIFEGGSVAKIGSGVWTVNGTIHAPVTVEGGRLGGNGTIDGPLTILAGGAVSAGASAGHLIVTGAYDQFGEMLAELDGPLQGVSYDWIDVLDIATFEQDARIRVLVGYEIGHGTTFDILTAANGITNVDLSGIDFDYSQAYGDRITWHAEIVDLDGTAGSAEALRLTAVPEPLSAVLLLLGAAGAGWKTRRRIRRA